jgi:predicted Holliday junction resolvase-like endonuclease
MKLKFSYVMLALALVVAGCAGYFSVWGLSQLFAGASTAVIIMATGLEVGKIVTTTALHRYWKKIAGGLRVYLTISVLVLMLITSAGIYGFLSNAYQKTANKLEIQNGQVSVLTGKKDLFQKNIDDNKKIIDQKNKRIEQLSDLRKTQELRLDSAKNNRNRNGARADIQGSNSEIQKLSLDVDGLNLKNSVLSDSISKYNVKILELNANSDVAAEIGPLKYISELTGTPMANVVNFLILLLIFVFDPLAVALVLMTNRIFEIEGETNPLEPKVKSTNEPVLNIDNMVEEPIMPDEQYDDEIIEEPVIEEPVIEEPVIEEPVIESSEELIVGRVKEPVIPTGKIQLEDIREIKNRGYSVNVPNPKNTNNTIERISSNKYN